MYNKSDTMTTTNHNQNHLYRKQQQQALQSIGIVLLCTCIVPFLMTYYHIRYQIYGGNNEMEIIRVTYRPMGGITTTSSGIDLSGIYGRYEAVEEEDEDEDEETRRNSDTYMKLLQIGRPIPTTTTTTKTTTTYQHHPWGVYQPDIIDVAYSAAAVTAVGLYPSITTYPYLTRTTISTPPLMIDSKSNQNNNTSIRMMQKQQQQQEASFELKQHQEEICIYISSEDKICGSPNLIQILQLSNGTNENSSTSSSRSRSRSNSPSSNKNHHHPHRRHWVLQFGFITNPATSLLLFLNCALAFVYWNYNISTEQTAIIYNRMVPSSFFTSSSSSLSSSLSISSNNSSYSNSFDVWRMLTGSTAHYEPMHLCMNMMTLYTIGHQIEGNNSSSSSSSSSSNDYPSIIFLFYNCSLIILVSVTWILIQSYIVQPYYIQHFHPNTPTIGFSGVLFVWIVIVSLQQSISCPIFFLSNFCVPTYTLFGTVKFSFSPIIQLLLIQVLLRNRVSFIGHLSGMLVGYILYWDLLPVRYLQPVVVVPVSYCLHLRFVRKLGSTIEQQHSQALQQQPKNHRMNQLLMYHYIVLFYSITVIGIFHSMTISYAMIVLYWYHMNQSVLFNNNNNSSNNNSSSSSGNPNTTIVWSKAYVLSAVLVLITDAMTMGGWMAFSYYHKIMPLFVIVIRMILLYSSMIVAMAQISYDEFGIFEWSFHYTIIQPCREMIKIFPWIVTPTVGSITDDPSQGISLLPTNVSSSSKAETAGSASSGGAFYGVGHRLGGSTSSSSSSNDHRPNPWRNGSR